MQIATVQQDREYVRVRTKDLKNLTDIQSKYFI